MKNKTLEPKTGTQASRSPYQAERAKAQATPVTRPACAGDGLLRLQRQAGNRAVQRLLASRQPEEEEEELQMKREPAAVQRQDLPEEEEEELMTKPEGGRVGPQGGQVPLDVEAAIRRARGGGQPLERALQEQMSASLAHDFSGVRVHTDSEADELNQQLQAKAFTTGPDIFFKRGAYDPGSGSGRELIAHELTHVAQQSTGRVGGDQSGMVVRPSGDAFEQEAEDVARQGRARQDKSKGEETRHLARPDLASLADILALQRTVGNQAVKRLLSLDVPPRESATYGREAIRAPLRASQAQHEEMSKGTEKRTLQRQLVTRSGESLPDGTLVACENPTFIGQYMVEGKRGGASYIQPPPMGGPLMLRHAGILTAGGDAIIEAMSGGIERNPVKTHPSSRYALACRDIGEPDIVAADIASAARSSVRADIKAFRGGVPRNQEKYALTKATLAVSKGDAKIELAQIRSELAGGDLPERQRQEKVSRAQQLERFIKALEGDGVKKYPALLPQDDLRYRPTGETYCVQFVVQAVQAALINKNKITKAVEWLNKIGGFPTVTDLIEKIGRGRWTQAQEKSRYKVPTQMIQRAHIGFRHLDVGFWKKRKPIRPLGKIPLMKGRTRRLLHEHIWFDKSEPGERGNIGFGKSDKKGKTKFNGLFTEPQAVKSRYKFGPKHYDDQKMRKAVQQVAPNFQQGTYDTWRKNCQHFVKAVTEAYASITQGGPDKPTTTGAQPMLSITNLPPEHFQ